MRKPMQFFPIILINALIYFNIDQQGIPLGKSYVARNEHKGCRFCYTNHVTTFEAFHKCILLSANLLFLMSDKLIKMILLLYYEEKKNDFLLQAISNFLFDFVFQSVLPLLVCCLAGKIFFLSKKALYSKANFNKLLFGKIIKSIHSPNVCP